MKTLTKLAFVIILASFVLTACGAGAEPVTVSRVVETVVEETAVGEVVVTRVAETVVEEVVESAETTYWDYITNSSCNFNNLEPLDLDPDFDGEHPFPALEEGYIFRAFTYVNELTGDEFLIHVAASNKRDVEEQAIDEYLIGIRVCIEAYPVSEDVTFQVSESAATAEETWQNNETDIREAMTEFSWSFLEPSDTRLLLEEASLHLEELGFTPFEYQELSEEEYVSQLGQALSLDEVQAAKFFEALPSEQVNQVLNYHSFREETRANAIKKLSEELTLSEEQISLLIDTKLLPPTTFMLNYLDWRETDDLLVETDLLIVHIEPRLIGGEELDSEQSILMGAYIDPLMTKARVSAENTFVVDTVRVYDCNTKSLALDVNFTDPMRFGGPGTLHTSVIGHGGVITATNPLLSQSYTSWSLAPTKLNQSLQNDFWAEFSTNDAGGEFEYSAFWEKERSSKCNGYR